MSSNTTTEDLHRDEIEFMYFLKGRSGSFKTGLYELYGKGDTINKMKLLMAFPELWPMDKYLHEEGYYEGLQRRWSRG